MSAFERICLVGWGAIGQRTAELLSQRNSPCKVVGVAVRNHGRERPSLPEGALLLTDPSEIRSCDPTLVVEAAGRESVMPWGEASLEAGLDFLVSSTSALVDRDVLNLLTAIAKRTAGRIIVPPGALGGVDALAAASRLELHRVLHRIIKPPAAWKNTAAEHACDLDGLSRATVFFKDTAAQAASAYPQNANVAVITSLAGIGLDRTMIELVADPAARHNTHEIHAEGEFGRMDIKLENRPLQTNPKSSEMTALNLVRSIENRVSPLVL